MKLDRLVILAASASLMASAAAASGYTITSIADPGQTNVGVAGINDSGIAVVGYGSGGGGAFTYAYPSGVRTPIVAPLFGNGGNTGTVFATSINATGTVSGYDIQTQNGSGLVYDWDGFVETGGAFTFINDPVGGANADTQVLGVNDSGQVWGLYNVPGGGGTEAYFTESGGVYTTIGHSGWSTVVVNGIDNAGDIVGSATIGGYRYGFVDSGGVYRTIFDPSGEATTIESVSKSGVIAGIFFDPSNFHNVGFIDNGGVFTNFAGKNGGSVSSVSVNDEGVVAFKEGGGNGADEVLNNGVYSVLGAPIENYGSNGSGPSMINDKGLVVGDYSAGFSSYEGFIAAPPPAPEPATWALMMLGVGGCGVALRSARRRFATA